MGTRRGAVIRRPSRVRICHSIMPVIWPTRLLSLYNFARRDRAKILRGRRNYERTMQILPKPRPGRVKITMNAGFVESSRVNSLSSLFARSEIFISVRLTLETSTIFKVFGWKFKFSKCSKGKEYIGRFIARCVFAKGWLFFRKLRSKLVITVFPKITSRYDSLNFRNLKIMLRDYNSRL